MAGRVRLEPSVESHGLYRGGDVGPVFHGDPDDPVVITTRPPAQMTAELKLGLFMALALIVGALALLGHTAAVAAVACATRGRRPFSSTWPADPCPAWS